MYNNESLILKCLCPPILPRTHLSLVTHPLLEDECRYPRTTPWNKTLDTPWRASDHPTFLGSQRSVPTHSFLEHNCHPPFFGAQKSVPTHPFLEHNGRCPPPHSWKVIVGVHPTPFSYVTHYRYRTPLNSKSTYSEFILPGLYSFF